MNWLSFFSYAEKYFSDNYNTLPEGEKLSVDPFPVSLCDPHHVGHRPLSGRYCWAISSWFQGATCLLPSYTGAPRPEQHIQGWDQCMGAGRTTRLSF